MLPAAWLDSHLKKIMAVQYKIKQTVSTAHKPMIDAIKQQENSKNNETKTAIKW